MNHNTPWMAYGNWQSITTWRLNLSEFLKSNKQNKNKENKNVYSSAKKKKWWKWISRAIVDATKKKKKEFRNGFKPR